MRTRTRQASLSFRVWMLAIGGMIKGLMCVMHTLSMVSEVVVMMKPVNPLQAPSIIE